jgi:quercetin dioxygenase-like cupin family protein
LTEVTFTAGDQELEISAGNIVVVDAQTKHRFEGASDELSRVVSVHPAAEVIQENLS